MQISVDQSFFGRVKYEEKVLMTTLKKRIRHSAFKIIQFCRKQSNKLKKRNEYQTILFPQDYEYEQSNEISQSLKNQYSKISNYLFYLTKSQLFIDNYHLKIIKKAAPLSMKFDSLGYGKLRQFANWVQKAQKNILIGITDLNIILIISIPDKLFFKFCIQSKKTQENAPIVNVSVYKQYLFAFSQQECHICKYLNLKNFNKGIEKLIQKVLTDKKITKGAGIQKDNKFYTFFIVQNCLIFQKLQMGFLLSKLDYKSKIIYQSNEKLSNLQIHTKKTNNTITHIIIAISTQSQVKLLSYSFQSQILTQLSSRQNPIFSINRKLPPFIKFIENQNYLLCAIAFQNRLYFIKIQQDYCSLSQRIRFDQPIEYIDRFGKSFGLVIITNLIKNHKNYRKIYITHQDKVISYSDFVYMPLIDKYQFNLQTNSTYQTAPLVPFNSVYIYDNREILIIGQNQIHRTVLNTWSGIYNQMKITQNIKLLKYLILLKNVDSPFLERPSSFQGLQSFFPTEQIEQKQILIQYYHLMQQQPQLVNINDNHVLMIPFIIQHQVSNLSEKTIENLLNWCLTYDQRLVQQLIVGGSDCGWEIAVSRGWIRAFKVMVQRGMELEMPILKLYSMALHQQKIKLNQDEEKIQYLTDQGQKYLNQMVDYILFILLNFFQDLPGNGTNLQFKNIILIIVKDSMWKFMMKFLPIKSINIISYIFCNEIRIKQINKYVSFDFLQFNKIFIHMKVVKSSTNSQLMVSHLSTVFQEMYSDQNMEYLQLQHSKLLVLKFQEFIRINSDKNANFKQMVCIYQILLNNKYFDDIFQSQFVKFRTKLTIKSYFKFRKNYLIQLLKTLARDQNNNVQRIFNQARSSTNQYTKYEQVQCEMIDFMVFIWQQIYYNIVVDILQESMCEDQKYSLQECDQRIKTGIRMEIKQILSDIEINNSQYQYLLVHILMSINFDNQFTSKIFNKFISCKNTIIKQRLFIWLRQTLPQSSSLQDQLIVKLKQVIQINNQQSRSILQNFYQGKQKQIIKKIDNDPYLQLQYLQLIIKNANEGLQRYYTNLHVQLVLKIKPEAIISILQTDNELIEYDIAEVLKMTLSINDFQGKDQILIYLYQREGEILLCIDTYLACLENLVLRYINLCEKNKVDQDQEVIMTNFISAFSEYQIQKNRVIQSINKKFQDSIKLLFRIPQLKYDYIARYLRKLNQIFKYISNGQYRYKSHYMDFIISYFGLFIVTLFQKNCLIQLSIWIQQQKNDFWDLYCNQINI